LAGGCHNVTSLSAAVLEGGLDGTKGGSREEGESMAMVTDPVCGMHIESEEAAGTIEFEGKTYFFCSQTCHDAFEADPVSYVT
jgi:YHS domain-containing protein